MHTHKHCFITLICVSIDLLKVANSIIIFSLTKLMWGAENLCPASALPVHPAYPLTRGLGKKDRTRREGRRGVGCRWKVFVAWKYWSLFCVYDLITYLHAYCSRTNANPL